MLCNVFVDLYNYNTTNKLKLKQNVFFESIVLQNELIHYFIDTYSVAWTDVEL